MGNDEGGYVLEGFKIRDDSGQFPAMLRRGFASFDKGVTVLDFEDGFVLYVFDDFFLHRGIGDVLLAIIFPVVNKFFPVLDFLLHKLTFAISSD